MIRIWNVETGALEGELKDSKEDVTQIAITPDGKTLASGSEDGAARLWDLEARQCRRVMKVNEGLCLSVAFSPDAKLLATDTSIARFEFGNVPMGRPRWPGDCGTRSTTFVFFGRVKGIPRRRQRRDDPHVEGSAGVWAPADNECVSLLRDPERRFRRQHCPLETPRRSDSSHRRHSRRRQGGLGRKRWNGESQRLASAVDSRLVNVDPLISQFRFGPKDGSYDRRGNRKRSYSPGGNAWIYNLETGHAEHAENVAAKSLIGITLTPDSTHLLLGHDEGLMTFNRRKRPPGVLRIGLDSQAYVEQLDFTPDGRLLIVRLEAIRACCDSTVTT